MPFIGKLPDVGAFRLIDSITTSATDTYALQVEGLSYFPSSARNLIVSLNGVTQAPESAYTVSGSNIIFDSALTASDVIDYILVIGESVDIGTPSDNTVGNAQLKSDLDFSGKTLTFSADQISGDAINGGTISSFASTGIDDNATSTAITIDSSENVGIGTASPSSTAGWDTLLEVSGTLNAGIKLTETDTANGDYSLGVTAGTLRIWDETASAWRMTLDSSGNIGIGTASPNISSGASGSTVLTISASASARNGLIELKGTRLSSGDVVSYLRTFNNAGSTPLTDIQSIRGASDTTGELAFFTSDTERMRIDSSGNLLVGKTSSATNVEGGELRENGQVLAVATDINPFFGARLGSDGDFAVFRKDGTTVGAIGNNAASDGLTIYSAVGTGVGLYANGIAPTNNSGTYVDNSKDIGAASVRFDDVYATNGTIQTSDVNEKQDTDVLSEAETRVAVAAKGLLRKFRWKSAVEEKGDEARVHFGVIAQDLQAAFEAEGLDAGDYGMFIHSTWTDEETGEERSRMGVRYSELLAFIIAAI